MRVLLVNIDSRKMKNLALEKIRVWYQERGHDVIYNFPLLAPTVDRIYVSIIYDWNKKYGEEYERYGKKVFIGGSGWDLLKRLPFNIEMVKPHVNIGFTTRGCIRKCPWCVVPKKEGGIRIVGDLLDLWDGKAKDIIVLDNNILGLPDHFSHICEQARRTRIRVDFNQGLDHRLLTEDIVKDLKSISHIEYHFAYDDPIYEKSVIKGIEMLQAGGIRRSNFLVLCGYNTTLRQDIERLTLLRKMGQQAFVMRYNNQTSEELSLLTSWANYHGNFYLFPTIEEFVAQPKWNKYAHLLKEA